MALILAMVGLYAFIAFTVSQRTREIGIRIALGASSNAIARLVLRDDVWLIVSGLLLGVAIALAATRGLSSLLHGVGPSDRLTIVVS